MAGSEYEPITVSRRIGAPAGEIFRILADPRRHLELDGSGMLRTVVSGTVVSGTGEPEAGRGHPNAEPEASRSARWGQRWSFDLAPDGPDATVVTEIFDCSRVPEDQRADINDGRIWVESMHRTLERLDRLCTGRLGKTGG